MGKGDKKTRRGKIHIGSTGRLRPALKKTHAFTPVEKPAAALIEQPEPVEEVPEKKTPKRTVKKPKEEVQ